MRKRMKSSHLLEQTKKELEKQTRKLEEWKKPKKFKVRRKSSISQHKNHDRENSANVFKSLKTQSPPTYLEELQEQMEAITQQQKLCLNFKEDKKHKTKISILQALSFKSYNNKQTIRSAILQSLHFRNPESRNQVISELDALPDQSLVILLDQPFCNFLGIYSHNPLTQEFTKLIGPRHLQQSILYRKVNCFYRFKCESFSPIISNQAVLNADAISVSAD